MAKLIGIMKKFKSVSLIGIKVMNGYFSITYCTRKIKPLSNI